MALTRRRRVQQDNIWPGFVDALATLLMVIIFLLMIFVMAQVFLSETLAGRESSLEKLNTQMSELSELLSLERIASKDLRLNMATLSKDLQTSVKTRDDLSGRMKSLQMENTKISRQLSDTFKTITADRATIELKLQEIAKLHDDTLALEALRDALNKEVRALASKLENTEGKIVEERQLADSTRAQNALLNKQMAAMRAQLSAIQEALETTESLNKEQKVQISALGKRLNTALATKVQELSKYRSEFFGELRKVLGRRAGIRIVGDRFVFQSEVLFNSGSASLEAGGQVQLQQLALTLKEIASRIPKKVEWILRVDGHTDDIPISTAKFASNWELSTQRAISVVKELINQGIPANRLAAAGFGQFQPLDTRQDEIAKRRNRRIELKLTQR